MPRGGRYPNARSSIRGGRNRGKRTGPPRQRNGFQSSRLQDVEDVSESETQDDYDSGSEAIVADEGQSASDDEDNPPQQSYASLLQILNTRRQNVEPPRKKRKVDDKTNGASVLTPEISTVPTTLSNGDADAALTEDIEDNAADEDGDIDSDDEQAVLQDPFENHYARMEEGSLKEAIATVTEKKRQRRDVVLQEDTKKLVLTYAVKDDAKIADCKIQDLRLKQRLLEGGSRVYKSLTSEQRDLARDMFMYRDIQYGCRTAADASNLRDLACLHALNHVNKTRDRVLKNNAKISQHEGEEELELRDQGFTRPKVLVIVPTKQACARFVESIARISEADQQENKARFLETFSSQDDDTWDDKPEDFRELFGGNHEEDFRVGLKFTRKTIKYFSGFYNSDIIFGSALGLMRTITTGGGSSKDNKKKAHDADFLSSIELVIVDHAAAIQMQNWQHLEYIFTQLNLIPKETHGCEFNRVRPWYLDGHAKYLRQTIVYTAYHTPEINALFTLNTSNISGISKYTPIYKGAMLSLPPTLPFTPSQSFLRFDARDPSTDSDARFAYFNTTILAPLLRQNSKGVLVFIPAYADFTRLRNHFSTSASTTSLSFGSISEYTPVKEVSRARSHFMNSRHNLLLYTERAHHHFRYRLKGVKKLIFYGLPENSLFWSELLTMVATGVLTTTTAAKDGNPTPKQNAEAGATARNHNNSRGMVRALFSKWDVLKLERIVGTERVAGLIQERGGDTFEFV